MQVDQIIKKIEDAIRRGDLDVDAAEAAFNALEIEWQRSRPVQVRLVFEVNLTASFGQSDEDVVQEAMAEIEVPTHYTASDVSDYEIMEV